MSRSEFAKKTKLAAFERSNGCCEHCFNKIITSAEYDHVLPDYLGGDNSLDNCECLCKKCHAIKTKSDRNGIDRARRGLEKLAGARNRKSRPMPGTKASGIKKKLNGSVERR
jgi:5-methylcytosine-specific restriction protein A